MLLHHPQPRYCETLSHSSQAVRYTETNALLSNEVEWIIRIKTEY